MRIALFFFAITAVAQQSVDILVYEAVQADTRGQSAEAYRLLRQAQSLNPKSTAVLNNLAVVLVHLGKPEDAADTFERSLTLQPNDRTASFNLCALLTALGQQNLREKQTEQGLKRLQRAVKLRPDKPDAYIGAALALLEEERVSEAKTMLAEAGKRFPDDSRLLLETGYANELEAQWSSATAFYKRALQAGGKAGTPMALLGRAQRESGDAKSSARTLTEAVRDFPQSGLPCFELARTLMLSEPQSTQIDSLLERAADLEPSRPEPLHWLARRALAKGDLDQAQASLRREIGLDPDIAEAHYLLAQVFRRKGDGKRSEAELTVYRQLREQHAHADAIAMDLQLK